MLGVSTRQRFDTNLSGQITIRDILSTKSSKPNLVDIWGKTFTFDRESDECAALLRTPNGIGTYYLALQHAAYVGSKTIESIAIYVEHGSYFDMVLKLMPVGQKGETESAGSGSGLMSSR